MTIIGVVNVLQLPFEVGNAVVEMIRVHVDLGWLLLPVVIVGR